MNNNSNATTYYNTKQHNYLVDLCVSPNITIQINEYASKQKVSFDDIITGFIYGHFDYWENIFLPTGNRLLVSDFAKELIGVITVFWRGVFKSYILSSQELALVNQAIKNKQTRINLGWVEITLVI